MSDYLIRVKTSAAGAVTRGIAAEMWDTASPLASLRELTWFINRIATGNLPGITSVEVQQNDQQGPTPVVLTPGTVPVPTSGQPAVGWVIVATAGNTVLTVGVAQVTQAFTTSQAITAVNLIQLVNGDPTMSKLVVASADPNGVVGKVILTALTLPWDHAFGGNLALAVTGTGTSVSAASLGGTNTAPARAAVNAPNNAISL